jgi:hypothetical protein
MRGRCDLDKIGLPQSSTSPKLRRIPCRGLVLRMRKSRELTSSYSVWVLLKLPPPTSLHRFKKKGTTPHRPRLTTLGVSGLARTARLPWRVISSGHGDANQPRSNNQATTDADNRLEARWCSGIPIGSALTLSACPRPLCRPHCLPIRDHRPYCHPIGGPARAAGVHGDHPRGVRPPRVRL